MPLIDGEYVKLTEEEIQQRLEENLEEKLDTSAQPGDLVTQQLAAEAKTLAENQEQALERVNRAAYLADATGRELDKVVDVIGLSRSEASSATGVVRLWRETAPTSDYTIPRGSLVQTAGSEPVEFSITTRSLLGHYDGFEGGDLSKWERDTDLFSVVESPDVTGDLAVEVPATEGATITSTKKNFDVGTTFNIDITPNSGSVTAFQFGVQDESNYLECVVSENAQDLRLRRIEDGAEAALSDNDSAVVPNGEQSHLEVDWSLHGDLTATLYETKYRDVELCSVSLTDKAQFDEGAVAIASLDANATALVDEVSNRGVLVNIQAIGSGTDTNVGPDKITTLSSPITGVEEVNNPVPTGSPEVKNINHTPLVIGEDRESDDELRDRAFNSTSIGGSATANALKTELRRIKGVQAITLKRNRENSAVDGLPAHSFEAIVYGGTDEEVASTIFNTASIDSNDVGGVNGTGVAYDITSSVTGETETINWSRPNNIELTIDVHLLTDDTFVGETEIRSIIVDYIGGTDIDGSFITGLDVGEDIYEAILRRKLVNPDETGVWEVDSLSIDANGDGTDDTTTTASGAEVLAIANNEVAVADARDGSITVTNDSK